MEVALVHSEQARERRRDPGGAPVVAVYERSVAGRSGLLRGLWACSATSLGEPLEECQVTWRCENSSILCNVSRG